MSKLSALSCRVVLGLLLGASSIQAGTFTVTTTADAGAGSLRDAIASVNAAAGPHLVDFDIPALECSAAGVCTIALASALPFIEEPVTIDGATQPAYGTAPANVCATTLAPSYMRVEVDGLALGSGQTILEFDPSGAAGVSEIRGLSLYADFLRNAIELTTPGAHRVQCNHLGVDGEGTSAPGSTTGVLIQAGGQGVIVGTDGDGVDDETEGNVFSGLRGVNINANDDNVVAGNYFGTTADGTTALAGCSTGVYIRQGSTNNRIGSNLDGVSDDLEGNVFAACSSHAIHLETYNGSGDANAFVGNVIGSTANGTPAGNAIGLRFNATASSSQNQLVSRNAIENNTTGIVVRDLVTLDPLSAGNCLTGNTTAFLQEGDAALVFENSWWGAADGPSGDAPGSGDPLSVTGLGSVDFDPFATGGCPLDFLTVTTTADAGPGSLREVLTAVNAASGPHVVDFEIPSGECSAAGVCTIVLASALPVILEPVRIDGTTQPAHGTAPANVCATGLAPSSMRVEIDGLGLGSGQSILEWSSGGAAGISEVRGLSLYVSGGRTAIQLTTPGAHRVQCNHLGVDAAGTTSFTGTTGVLLQLGAQGAIVGTDGDGVDDLAERNVLSGLRGVNINANDENVVAGNYFGTTADGTTALAGCSTGVYMRQSSTNNRVGSNLDGSSDDLEGNVFAGCTSQAIHIETYNGSGDANAVVGNVIGSTDDGTPAGNAIGIRYNATFNSSQNHLVSENTIENNTTGILVRDLVALDPLSEANCFAGNTTAFRHEGDAALVFENSWWDAVDGPSGDGPGSGDPLSVTGAGSVDFDPFDTVGCPLPEPGAGLSLAAGLLTLVALSRRRRHRPGFTSQAPSLPL